MPAVKLKRGENPYAKTADMVAYCDLCGDRFTHQKHLLEKSDGCYCSQECRYEYRRREKYGWHCLRCGERLEGKTSWCSDECIKTDKEKWKDQPEYRGKIKYRIRVGGIEPLPYNGDLWQKRRSEALERDNHKCQICGLYEEEHISQYDRGLSVHHKTARRAFDSAEEAHKLTNLITLCCRCHGLVEKDNICLNAGTDDDRIDRAVEDIEPLADIRPDDDLDDRIRQIVNEEIEQ